MPCDADVDPGAGGHLAVHHQALAIELVEMVPGRPVRHEVGIGDQHARRVGVGAEDADRLARLDEQRLVVLEPAQRRDDAVEALPVARRPADAAVDDELARAARRPRGRDCSSACAAAASVSQLLALSSAPRGARMTRVVVDAGHRQAPWVGSVPRRSRQACKHVVAGAALACGRGARGVERRRPVASVDAARRLDHIAAAGELQLDRVDAFAGLAVDCG